MSVFVQPNTLGVPPAFLQYVIKSGVIEDPQGGAAETPVLANKNKTAAVTTKEMCISNILKEFFKRSIRVCPI